MVKREVGRPESTVCEHLLREIVHARTLRGSRHLVLGKSGRAGTSSFANVVVSDGCENKRQVQPNISVESQLQTEALLPCLEVQCQVAPLLVRQRSSVPECELTRFDVKKMIEEYIQIASSQFWASATFERALVGGKATGGQYLEVYVGPTVRPWGGARQSLATRPRRGGAIGQS